MKGIDVTYADLFGTISGQDDEDSGFIYGTLYDVYEDYVRTTTYVEESTGISAAYLQFTSDGITYNLVNPDYGLLSVGSIEERPFEFAQYGDNEQVPPTIYNSVNGWLCTACMPIIDSDTGEPVAMFCFDADMNKTVDELAGFMWFVSVLAILMTLIVLAVTLYLIRRFATKPLRQLTDATCNSYEDVEGQTVTTPIELDIHSNDEIGDLYHEIRSMQARIEGYAQNLALASAEEERVKTELRMASAIQEASLPSAFPAFPDRPEFNVYASMDAAKDVGGDFYDFFLIDDDHLALVIADVSGKGVPAALFMMVVKIMISNSALGGGTPAEILARVNAQICEHNKTKTFVTVWLGILDTRTGELICSNAGHDYPWIRGADGTFAMLRDKHSLVVGGSKKTKFTDYTLRLNPGDAIFVHTDGVTEAANHAHDFFGRERLDAALASCAGANPEEVVRSVRESVDAFVDDAEQFDDMTMLCVEFRGTEAVPCRPTLAEADAAGTTPCGPTPTAEADAAGTASYGPAPAETDAAGTAFCDSTPAEETTLEAKLENVQKVIDFVAEQLDSLECTPKARVQLLAAVDEIASNVARYAYASDAGGTAGGPDADGADASGAGAGGTASTSGADDAMNAPDAGNMTIRFATQKGGTVAEVTFIDQGTAYNPLEEGEPDTTLNAKKRKIGGLGIFLVKKTMDELEYERKDSMNILHIRKNLGN